jgi:MBG domain (YGX type)/Lectin C-type domain
MMKKLVTASMAFMLALFGAADVFADSQTITFDPISNKIYGDLPFVVSATASSGLPVSFNIVSGPAVVTNGTIILSGAGSIVVRASQSGNAQYSAAPGVDQAFTVAKATLTITANNASRVYGTPNPTFTASYSGLVNGDTPVSLSGSLNFFTSATINSGVGAFAIGCSGLGSSNYYINYVDGALNVIPVQWQAGAGGNGHFYEPVLATNGITWTNAQTMAALRGGYLVTITSNDENEFVSGLINANPDFWVPDGGGGDGPWIGAIKLPGPTSAINWTWVNGEPFSFYNWASGQPNNFGGNQDHIQFYNQSGLMGKNWNDAGNFESDFAHGFIIEYDTFMVRNGQTINFAPLADKFSGDMPFTVNASASSGLPVAFSVLSGPATVSSNVVTITGVGTVVIRASQFGNTNYYAAPDVDRSFKVSRSQWQLNAGGNGHFYEVVRTPGGITWSNAQAAAENKGGYLATITSSNENEFVYNMIANNTNLWVYDAGESLGSWLGGMKLPGPTNPTNWAWITGEPFVYNNWDPAQPNNDGGSQDHIQFFSMTTKFTNLWNDLGNTEAGLVSSYIVEYERDPDTRTNQTISFAPLPDRSYGDAPFAVSATSSSGMPVTFSITYGPAVVSNNTVIITGAGTITVRASLPGNTNYFQAPDVDQSYNVNQAALVLIANNASRPYGVANPVLTGTIIGLHNGDNITAIYNTTATTSSPAGTYPIVPTLLDPNNRLPNYVVSTTNGTLTVTPVTLSVTANNASRPFGMANPAFTGSIAGIVNADNITATYSTIATSNSPAGTYPIIVTLIDPGNRLGNYLVNATNGTLTITPTTPPPPPLIQSITVNDATNVVLTWSSVSNSIYHVQYTDDPGANNWTDLAPRVTAIGNTTSKTNSVGNSTQRYYRVVAEP